MGWGWLLILGAVTVACGETERNRSGDSGGPTTTDGEAASSTQGATDGQAASSSQGTTGTEGPVGGDAGSEPSGDCSGVEAVQLYYFIGNQVEAEGLRNVGKLDGSLLISSGVTDLSPLECLSEVTGDLTVYEAAALENLNGLDQLTTLGGSLYIGHRCDEPAGACVGNPVLRDIDALRNLKQASAVIIEAKCFGEGNDENCARNAALTNVRFDELRNVERVVLHENPALAEVRFGALATATGLYVQAQPALQVLQFPALEALDVLEIRNTPALEALGDFEQLTQVGEIALLATGLVDLRGLEALHELGSLELSGNPQLASLEGLTSVEIVRQITIDTNQALTTLSGLDALVDAEDGLGVEGNSNLVSLDGLESLQHAGRLWLNGNPALGDIEALASLEVVSGSLVLWNTGLVSVSGLGRLAHAGSVSIQNNALLESLQGFESLSEIDESLGIFENPELPTCEAEWLRDQIGIENIGAVSIEDNNDSGVCE